MVPAKAKVQYTVRGVPREIDAVLRRKARQRGLSLNRLLLEELAAAGGGSRPRVYRRLKELGGRWQKDTKFDRILAAQRRIDRDLWK